jgi:hypothetical protein
MMIKTTTALFSRTTRSLLRPSSRRRIPPWSTTAPLFLLKDNSNCPDGLCWCYSRNHVRSLRTGRKGGGDGTRRGAPAPHPFNQASATMPTTAVGVTQQQQPTTTTTMPMVTIDFEVAAKIEGEESHVAIVDLRPGEVLRAESGAMLFMTEGVVSTLFVLNVFYCWGQQQ